MKTELDIVRDVSDRLSKLGIPYMLTGSMAMNYYATPRMTRDIDLVIEWTPEHTRAFVQEFGAEYYIPPEPVLTAARASSQFNLIHKESVIKVDCIVRRESPYGQAEFARRQAVAIGDFVTFIVSKEDLILSKLWWTRDSRSELQLQDVRTLLATGYHEQYVLEWAKRIGVEELLRECRRG